jgi:hypothetical protein
MNRRCAVVLVVVAALARPAPALAHISTGTLSTTFRATVSGFRPAGPGLSASVLGGDQRLRLSVPPADRVIVLGLVGEPFLRFDPSGVWVNAASPTAATAGIVHPGPGTDRISWQRVSGGHVFTWHENRLRPLPQVTGGGERRVATWSVPLVVNGRRTVLTGAEWWGPPPPLVAWIGLAAITLGGAGLATRQLSQQALRLLALGLLPPVVVSLSIGWAGIFLVDGVTMTGVALGTALVVTSVAFVGLATAAVSGPAQVCVAGLVGALSATFAIPQLSLFAHAFVRSALPGFGARLLVWVALAGGSALAIVCIPAFVELLEHSPFESLRPPGS